VGSTIVRRCDNDVAAAATASPVPSAANCRSLRCRHDCHFRRRYHCRSPLVDCCLPPPLPLFLPDTAVACPPPLLLLSASAIPTVAATATAAPVPSTANAATALLPLCFHHRCLCFRCRHAPLLLFLLLPCHCFCFRAIATMVSAMAAITDKSISLQVLWLQRRWVAAATMIKPVREQEGYFR
jgi:hypothetical protein